MKRRLTRRELIKYGMLGLGTLAAGGGGLYSLVSPRVRSARADEDVPRSPFTFTPFTVDLPVPPLVPSLTQFTAPPFTPQCNLSSGSVFQPIPGLGTSKLYEIHMRKQTVQIIPGVNTEIWGYNGQYPGPTFRVRHNEPAIVRFFNDLGKDRHGLDIDTIVHNHGGHQSSESDGSPVDPNRFIHPGSFKDFCYPNIAPINLNPQTGQGQQDTNDFASTQWYHDHFHEVTGRNVYMGLAGFYLLRDELEQGLIDAKKLPAEEFDIPLVVQDRVFAADGSLLFNPGEFDGVLGDVFVVNGKAQPKFHVQRRKYRFRILNGADARWWEFRLRVQTGSVSSGLQFLQIGNDSWLLPFAIQRDSIRLGLAERADVIIDFSNIPLSNPPAEVFLVNVLQQTDGRGPDEVRLPGTPILKFIVDQPTSGTPDATIAPNAPGDLSVTLRPHTPILASEIVRTRHFVFDSGGIGWVINDQEFDPNRDDATPKINTAERWILTNDGGDWAHPIHMHLEAHQIQRFNGRPPALYNSFKKDTTPLLGDDEAEVFIRFRTFTGRYVFHCHNLQHEDRAMMGVHNVKL